MLQLQLQQYTGEAILFEDDEEDGRENGGDEEFGGRDVSNIEGLLLTTG